MHPSHMLVRRGPEAAAPARAASRIPGLLAGLALLLATAMASMPAWSAQASSVAGSRGLNASLADGEEIVAQAAPPPRVQGVATSRLQVTVRRGESLDALIRRSLPDLPFKDVFLRQAVLDMNPGVLRAGATQRLAAGTVLQLPSLDDLIRLLGAAPASPSPGAGTAPHGSDSARPAHQAASAANERKRWVRYP